MKRYALLPLAVAKVLASAIRLVYDTAQEYRYAREETHRFMRDHLGLADEDRDA